MVLSRCKICKIFCVYLLAFQLYMIVEVINDEHNFFVQDSQGVGNPWVIDI